MELVLHWLENGDTFGEKKMTNPFNFSRIHIELGHWTATQSLENDLFQRMNVLIAEDFS